MNQPDRFEKFVLPEGKAKIEFVKDDKISNAATFVLERETHTIGNLIRIELLHNDNVIFAGYRMPHPLRHNIHVRVQTDGEESPVEAFQCSVNQLIEQVDALKKQFSVHHEHYRGQRNNIKLAMAQSAPADEPDTF